VESHGRQKTEVIGKVEYSTVICCRRRRRRRRRRGVERQPRLATYPLILRADDRRARRNENAEALAHPNLFSI
jgi:hypothetical protein